MKFSDEILMAYAEGELGEPVRSQVERALRADPALAARVAQHKAMRSRVSHVFASIVNESIPPRPQPGTSTGKVVHLNAVRAARQQQQLQTRERPRWAWQQWVALAAAIVFGIVLGAAALWRLAGNAPMLAVGTDGALVAQGALADSLSKQLASSGGASGSRVRIGASFIAKDGNYCRSFAVGTAAGLACMAGGQWRIPVLQEGTAGQPDAYRQSTSEIPDAVLAEIDRRIAGAALDVDGERLARQRSWKR